MHLENLYLANFKNYEEAKIDFSKYINALVGSNGSGKTNLLDAIYFLSMTKSAFSAIDHQCIRHDQSYYSLIGKFKTADSNAIVCNTLSVGKRKKILVDKNPINKAADFIGSFPTVMIAPNDHALITEGGGARRKFFDSIICQLNKTYLLNLIDYNHALKQRNRLLKQFAVSGNIDQDLIDPYDNILLSLGKDICKERSIFCKQYLKKIEKHYKYLSEGKESIGLDYQSQLLSEDYKESYHLSFQKDLLSQRTNVGVHRDEYLFEMDAYLIKKFGSQGQQKSFLIALKLAQFDIMEETKGFKPILLMDDIFDKLDDHRIQKLTEMIEHHEFGQVFITDARPERSQHFLEKLNIEWKAITIDNGKLTS